MFFFINMIKSACNKLNELKKKCSELKETLAASVSLASSRSVSLPFYENLNVVQIQYRQRYAYEKKLSLQKKKKIWRSSLSDW